MTTALYRLSSNEVIKISVKNQQFAERDTAFWGVLTDPTTPDGTNVRNESTDPPGPLRELGFAKIAEPGLNNVRNATQLEIDTFEPAEIDDDLAQKYGSDSLDALKEQIKERLERERARGAEFARRRDVDWEREVQEELERKRVAGVNEHLEAHQAMFRNEAGVSDPEKLWGEDRDLDGHGKRAPRTQIMVERDDGGRYPLDRELPAGTFVFA